MISVRLSFSGFNVLRWAGVTRMVKERFIAGQVSGEYWTWFTVIERTET